MSTDQRPRIYGIILLDWPTDRFLVLEPNLNSKDWWFEAEDLLYYLLILFATY